MLYNSSSAILDAYFGKKNLLLVHIYLSTSEFVVVYSTVESAIIEFLLRWTWDLAWDRIFSVENTPFEISRDQKHVVMRVKIAPGEIES